MSDQTTAIIGERMAHVQKQIEERGPIQTVEQREVLRQNKISELRATWNAPERQIKATALERSGPWGATEKILLEKIGSGFCVALIGKRGPGKTQLGVELMRHVTNQCKSAHYTTAVGFFLAIKSSYKKDSPETEEDVINRFAKYSFLVVDEIGQRAETAWEDRIMFEMLDRRYQGIKDTLLLSNQELDAFTESIGDSLASRMNETGGIIQCYTWKSFR